MRWKLLMALAVISLIVLSIPAADAQNNITCPLPTLASGSESDAPLPPSRRSIEIGETAEWFIERCSTRQTEFMFEGQADSVFTVVLKATQNSSGTPPCIALVSEDGSLIGTGTAVTSDNYQTTLMISYALLPTSEQYRIIGMPCNNSSGLFSIQLIQTHIEPVSFNTVIQGTIDPMQGSSAFSIEGQAGDEIYIQIDSQTAQIAVEMFCIPRAVCGNPTGSIATNVNRGIYNTPVRLPYTGKYLITVRPLTPITSIQLSVNLLQPTTIQYGDKVDVEFDTDTTLHAFRFSGSIADMVQIHVDGGDKVDTALTLIQKESPLAVDDDSGHNYDPEIINFALMFDGDYLILLQPVQFNNTGHVSLTLSSTYIDLDGKPQLVTLGLKQKSVGMAFTGKAGEQIEIRALNLTTNNNAPQIQISARQNGKTIAEGNQVGGSGSGLIFTVPDDGKVSVIISINNSNQSTLEVSATRLDRP